MMEAEGIYIKKTKNFYIRLHAYYVVSSATPFSVLLCLSADEKQKNSMFSFFFFLLFINRRYLPQAKYRIYSECVHETKKTLAPVPIYTADNDALSSR